MLPLIAGAVALSAFSMLTKKVVESKVRDSVHQGKTELERMATETAFQICLQSLILNSFYAILFLAAYFGGLYVGDPQFFVAFTVFSVIFTAKIIRIIIITFTIIRVIVETGTIFPRKILKHYTSIEVHRQMRNLSAPSRLLNSIFGSPADEITDRIVDRAISDGLFLKVLLRAILFVIGYFLYNFALNFVINQNIGLISFVQSIVWPVEILFM